MEFFLSFRSFRSHKKVTKSFFSGHALLSFHKMQKILKQHLISIKAGLSPSKENFVYLLQW